MTKSVALLVIVGAVVAATLWAQDRRPEAAIPKHPPGGFMQAKLEHAQQVLAGLALEDFDLIIRQSHELGKMSQNPSWQVLRTAEYSVQSQEF